MLISLWSVKGGVGCSVTTALLALSLARRDGGVVVVDLGGDQPLVLGCPPPTTPGLTDWLSTTARDGSVGELVVQAGGGVGLIPRGTAPWPEGDNAALIGELSLLPTPVVVDAGMLPGSSPRAVLGGELAAQATRSILVTRPCYLALSRAAQLPVVPSGVVLVRERNRALTTVDVEAAVGAPVVAQVDVDPAISRAVDAGLLRVRQPRGLRQVLGAVA